MVAISTAGRCDGVGFVTWAHCAFDGFQTVTLMNEKLEDDNRNLMMQLQALLNQNHELLTGCLDSKDQLAEEQKAYM